MAWVILYYKNSEGGLQLLYCVNVCVCGGLPMNLCDAIAYCIPLCIRTCILYSDVFVEGIAWLPSLAKRVAGTPGLACPSHCVGQEPAY